MKRKADVVILCEDQDHETFIRRFLQQKGWDSRRMRVVPFGTGAADKHVADSLPEELQALRNRHAKTILVVMIDGDRYGVDERLRWLEHACRQAGVLWRSDRERVAIFVPTWNLETWFHYLGGNSVTEGKKDYPRLNKPSDCQELVETLCTMCDAQNLRKPAPPSLERACEEYHGRVKLNGSTA